MALPGPVRAVRSLAPGGLAIDPNGSYTSEPAPMGITDYGVTPSGVGYTYATPLVQGTVSITSLFDSSSVTASALTFQLNVEDVVSGGGSTYVYWIQDVAFFDTSINGITWEDNVWNLTSGSGTPLPAGSVAGNGTINSGIYYADLAQNYSGSGVSLSEPTTVIARAVASNVSGVPHVGFEYNDGFGWITYDNVTFPFLTNGTNHGFLVDGTRYIPGSGGFFDAEWVMGGPGGGSSQKTVRANLNMSLAYWNGHNLQSVRAAWSHGGNTAETVSNVVDDVGFDNSTGAVYAHVTNGSGPLTSIYGASSTSTLRVVAVGVPAGAITLNGAATPYSGGRANFTLAPGTYEVGLIDNGTLAVSANVTLAAGEFRSIQLQPYAYYPLTFVSSGLPSGTAWSVTVGSTGLAGSSTGLATTARNGTHPYAVGGVPGYFLLNYTGAAVVLGGPTVVNLAWAQTMYEALFLAQNYLPGTDWSVTVAGQQFSASSDTITIPLPNGTYAFVVGVPASVNASPVSDQVTVLGGGPTTLIDFSLAPGELSGSVSPGAATVTVDGSGIPVTGGTFRLALSPGTYVLRATLAGYRSSTQNITINAGVTSTVTFSLVAVPPTPGTLGNGNSTPTFAGVPESEWAVGAAVTAGVLVVALGAFALTRRRRPPVARTNPPT